MPFTRKIWNDENEVIMIKICNLCKRCCEEILYKMFILLWKILFFNKLKSIPPRKSEFKLESTSSLCTLFFGTTHSSSLKPIAKTRRTHNCCLNSIVQGQEFVQRSRIRTSIFIITVCIYFYVICITAQGWEMNRISTPCTLLLEAPGRTLLFPTP